MKASIIEISMAVFGGIDLYVTKNEPYVIDNSTSGLTPLVFGVSSFLQDISSSLLSDPIEMFHPFCCNMYTSSPLLDRVCLCKRLETQDMSFIIMY